MQYIFLAKQELSFRSHNENKYSVNKGHYIELLIYNQEFDPLLTTIFRHIYYFSRYFYFYTKWLN